MVHPSNIVRCIVMSAVVLWLAACSSDSVNQLSVEAGDAALVFSIELDEFGRTSRQVADARAQTIARVAALLVVDRAAFDENLTLIKYYEFEGKTKVKVFNSIKEKSDEFGAAEKTALEEADKALANIQNDLETVGTESKKYEEFGKGLLQLSKRDNVFDRAEFIVKFLKEVKSAVDKAKEDGKAGAKKAEDATKEAATTAEADSAAASQPNTTNGS